MKNYLVIGNPIEHSLSPKLHNHWIKKYDINAIYEKKKLSDEDLKNLFLKIRNKEINGVNVTVPFKQKIISYLDDLSTEAKDTQSVNTIFLRNKKIVGHNTDIFGFENAIRNIKFDVSNKKILILGAGGVVPSIIYSLNKMNSHKIMVSNRTASKVENLKNLFKNIVTVEWGEIPDFDMVINATSVGLKNTDEINLNFTKVGKEKIFYDVIYNPKLTNFLKIGMKLGNRIENGKKMFIYQAAESFKIWHGINPEINEEISSFLDL